VLVGARDVVADPDRLEPGVLGRAGTAGQRAPLGVLALVQAVEPELHTPGMMSRVVRVCIAGATGWAGRARVGGVASAPELELGSAVSRWAAGTTIEGAPVYGSVAEALDGIDVLVDYTSATAVKANVHAALDAGVAVVVGSSGLSAADYEAIDA